jgi:toxin ParE1/3/4
VNPPRKRWTVNLTSAATTDFDGIMEWTAEQFGRQQAETYAATLVDTINSLAEWPTTIGVKACDSLSAGFFTLHTARTGRKARHIIVFRADPHRFEEGVQVVRILHDSMDMARHIESEPH